jgi:hypothetical protein
VLQHDETTTTCLIEIAICAFLKKNSPMLQQDVTSTTCLLLSIKKKQGRQLNQVMTVALESNETKPSHLRKNQVLMF